MYKTSIWALLCASSFASQANVLFTEYVEGSGNNKAVEISNLGSTSVDLATQNFKLSLYANGNSNVQATMMLEGLLAPNASLVIYNNSASDEFKKASPQGLMGSAVTSFNGDDTLVLSSDDGILDVIGQYQLDPGSYFGTSSDNTKDHTLRRQTAVVQGDTLYSDAFDPSLEWTFFGRNTADGLGCVGTEACSGDEPIAQIGTAAGANDGIGAIEADGGDTGGGDTGGGDTGGGDTGGGDTGGGDTGGGDTGGGDTSVCFNCPDLSKIKDRSEFVDNVYYLNALAAGTNDAAALKAAISQDISAEHKQLSYSEVWTALTHTDQDPDNMDNVILLYKGTSLPKTSNGSGAQSSNPDNWNREHVWAKSHGFPSTSQLGYTDIHHLRPADISVNSDRSDHDFENGGEPNPEAPDNFEGNKTWEPRTAVKGDVARMMMYMDVRYAGLDENMPDLVLVDSINTDYADSSDATAEFGNLCTLLEWHQADPVDEMEVNRNHTIYEFQGNRNPFIDHPEWAQAVFGAQCSTAVVGDMDQDGDVDISDIQALSRAVLTQQSLDATLDLNSDGVINVLDVRTLYGMCTNAGCVSN